MLDDTPRLKMMVSKLADLCSRGHIDNNWEETFIFDVKGKLERGQELSPKQTIKLEELFERN